MSQNSLKLAQPEAVFDIVKDIHELTCQRGPLANIPYIFTSSFTSLIWVEPAKARTIYARNAKEKNAMYS